MSKKFKKLECIACGSKIVYTLKDGTVVCRHCGHREIKTTEQQKGEQV